MNVLKKGLESLGFEENRIKEVLPLLESYVSELELFNSAYDLVGASSREEIYTRHILDSLSPFKEIKRIVHEAEFDKLMPSFVDIGSGAGLPGIPLAICFPNYSFTLLERMAKRCAFLENVVTVLALKNVVVVNSEAEKYTKNLFDFAVFRAFRPLDVNMTKTILSLLKPEAYALAYKGKKEKIESEMNEIKNLIEPWETYALNLPFVDSVERHLVVFKAANNEVLIQSR